VARGGAGTMSGGREAMAWVFMRMLGSKRRAIAATS
jgi:hypothetical protein